MPQIYYIAPRKKRAQKRPFRLQNGRAGGGHAALLASVIGQAQNDYLAGDRQTSTAARAYFMTTYQHHAGMLGLADGLFPAGIEAVEVET